MAKKKMLCPFSSQLCRNCPVYRGRHYALCFSRSYRGYLGKAGEQRWATPGSSFETASKDGIVVPEIGVRRPLDLSYAAPRLPQKEI